MKIYIMTDLEGVAGVLDFDNWCSPDSRYYELAKEFLTLEVNAAVDGFLKGGATEIIVADGHGPGGINPKLLDQRAKLMRGWPTVWPLLLDKTYDFVACVGQHAKAGTEYAHIAHTQDSGYLDLSINGISIGEFGQFAMCASELEIRSIFASGDEALIKEAKTLVPGIETVAVKKGTTPGKGEECTKHTYIRRNNAAIHIHPIKARQLIKEGAFKAIQRAHKEDFGIIPLKSPFERVAIFRADNDNPKRIAREKHSTSVSALLNLPFKTEPLKQNTKL
ncbi:MAG: M55 family metallopeptidase [Candidatus Theseobacter exili]|nr:M55 family metallopeptidase [Candidatus Theseobacter exili]